MSKKGSKSALFWTSYSDLMTTLFFVMLVLFIVVTIAMGRIVQSNKTIVDEYNRVKERIVHVTDSLNKIQNVIVANEQAVKKIREIENSIKNIDHNWFEYQLSFLLHFLLLLGQSEPLLVTGPYNHPK